MSTRKAAEFSGTLQDLKRELKALDDPGRARNSAWFFKTGKGEYGEGDRFLGITVPVQRGVALRHRHLALPSLARLLESDYHEYRFVALEILVAQYEKAADDEVRQSIFDFYLAQTARINNWDLVDTSASYIIGQHLLTRSRDRLYLLARSDSLWERRIAIVSTFAFIKAGEIDDTFRIAEMLLADREDLIRKAVGWALRETGRVSRTALLNFLHEHYSRISRTALRYAIEHFTAAERKEVLAGGFTSLLSI